MSDGQELGEGDGPRAGRGPGAPGASRSILDVPLVPRGPRAAPPPCAPGPAPIAADPPDPDIRRSFVRIRHYRGNPGFHGRHELFVRCPHCRAEGDVPETFRPERILRFDCGGCGLIFDAEILRTMHSLRVRGR